MEALSRECNIKSTQLNALQYREDSICKKLFKIIQELSDLIGVAIPSAFIDSSSNDLISYNYESDSPSKKSGISSLDYIQYLDDLLHRYIIETNGSKDVFTSPPNNANSLSLSSLAAATPYSRNQSPILPSQSVDSYKDQKYSSPSLIFTSKSDKSRGNTPASEIGVSALSSASSTPYQRSFYVSEPQDSPLLSFRNSTENHSDQENSYHVTQSNDVRPSTSPPRVINKSQNTISSDSESELYNYGDNGKSTHIEDSVKVNEPSGSSKSKLSPGTVSQIQERLLKAQKALANIKDL